LGFVFNGAGPGDEPATGVVIGPADAARNGEIEAGALTIFTAVLLSFKLPGCLAHLDCRMQIEDRAQAL
jgi:hypothetical protein